MTGRRDVLRVDLHLHVSLRSAIPQRSRWAGRSTFLPCLNQAREASLKPSDAMHACLQLLAPTELWLWSAVATDVILTAVLSYNLRKMKRGFNRSCGRRQVSSQGLCLEADCYLPSHQDGRVHFGPDLLVLRNVCHAHALQSLYRHLLRGHVSARYSLEREYTRPRRKRMENQLKSAASDLRCSTLPRVSPKAVPAYPAVSAELTVWHMSLPAAIPALYLISFCYCLRASASRHKKLDASSFAPTTKASQALSSDNGQFVRTLDQTLPFTSSASTASPVRQAEQHHVVRVQLAGADRSFDGRAGALGIHAGDTDGEEKDEMKELGNPISTDRDRTMPVVSIVACFCVQRAL